MVKKSENKKKQIRINLDEDVAEKLAWVVSANKLKNESDYINAILKWKFENISENSTVVEMRKESQLK